MTEIPGTHHSTCAKASAHAEACTCTLATNYTERTSTHERNTEWWTAHPEFREKYSKMRWDADTLARSVVHWHHNVESAKRHAPDKLDGEQFFLRQYAIGATQAWLIAAQTEIETYPANHEHWRGYGHTDQECLIRNLQVALDDFEANTRDPYSPVLVGTPGSRSAGVG